MMNTIYPSIQDRQRPIAVSYEAQFVRHNIDNCHVLFVGQSVFVQELYAQQIQKRFDFLNSIWKNETLFSSSVSDITNNSAYRSIIDLGQDAIPLIINDLKNNDSNWFYALEALTGQNPIRETHRGMVQLMKNDWLEWAKKNYNTDEN